MDEEQELAFFLEWHDPQSGLKKGYIMHYHGDDTVELVRAAHLSCSKTKTNTQWHINLFAWNVFVLVGGAKDEEDLLEAHPDPHRQP